SSERMMDALYLMKGELIGLTDGNVSFDSSFEKELNPNRLASMLYEAMRLDPNIEISNEDLKDQLERLLAQDPVLQKNLVDLFVGYLNMDASTTVGDDLNAWLQEQGEFLQRFWHSLRESKIWNDTVSEFRSLVNTLLPSE
ncbi:MAG: hypothetical protein Q4P72_03170, partial [Eubacteriales bacterium]|nr:hypothetical protein [Eubacteriales bacterium]